MPDTADFLLYQGSDWSQQIVLQNDDGSIFDLTGCQAHLKVKAFPQSPVILLDISSAAGTITITPAAGQLNWLVPASQTINFQASTAYPLIGTPPQGSAFFGYYDLLIEYPDGEIPPPYLSGRIFMQLGITPPF
jgi:hypothetical protein